MKRWLSLVTLALSVATSATSAADSVAMVELGSESNSQCADGETTFACERCGKQFAVGGVLTRCAVYHGPGTCCHYGQREITSASAPEIANPTSADLESLSAVKPCTSAPLLSGARLIHFYADSTGWR